MIHASMTLGEAVWQIDLSAGVDLSIPLHFSGSQPNAFGLEPATKSPVRDGNFVGSTEAGGSLNCFQIQMAPHGNGTHTECVGHIVNEQVTVSDVAPLGLSAGILVTVDPVELSETDETYGPRSDPGDRVITREHLTRVWERHPSASHATSLIIRTGPNTQEKLSWQYSGTNPPYLTRQAMEWIVEEKFDHLLLDLPSVDREEDDGWLGNHHRFWGVEQGSQRLRTPTDKTITELVYVPNKASDGHYAVQLHVPAFMLDAAPSRPVLFPMSIDASSGEA